MGLLDAPLPLGAISGLNLVQPTHLRRWRAALGDADFARVVISCFGDSITEGRYANGAAATDAAAQALWDGRGWPARLRKLFQPVYGDIGPGYIVAQQPLAQFDGRIAYSGTVSNSNTMAPFGFGVQFANGASATFTLPACVGFDIHAWHSTGVTGVWTYTIDGGAPITPAAATGADTLYTVSVAGLSLAAHTVVINGPPTLRVDIAGVRPYKTTTGVEVNRFGFGGGLANRFSTTTRGKSASHLQTATKLGIFMFGYNDWANQPGYGTGVGQIPSAYKATLKAETDYLTTTAGGCALLVPDPYGTATGAARPFAQTDYTAVMRDLANENDHVAFLDLNRVWGTWEQANTAGLRFDFVHPNQLGFGDVGRLIHSVLTRPNLVQV